MDNLLPMYERKLSLPWNSLFSRRGLRFRRLAGRLPKKARLTITYFPDVFQMTSAKWPTAAPLRIF